MNNIMTMSVNGYIMLNVFSSLVLLIIFSKKTIRSAALEHILFEGMIATTIILLITDTIIWILSGETGTGLRIVNIFSTAVYYICHPLLLSLWTLYADYSLFRSRKRITRLGAIVFSVNLIFYFFIIASIWNGYIFIINKDNIYSRGSQFIIFFAACYSFIVYTFL